jgi:hypothetical protein
MFGAILSPRVPVLAPVRVPFSCAPLAAGFIAAQIEDHNPAKPAGTMF